MGSVQRTVIFAYLIIGVLVAITLARMLGTVALAAGIPDPTILGKIVLTDLIGVAIAGGVAFWLYRKPDVHEWALDVVNELRKVTWPSRKETQTATVVVIVATLLAAVVLAVFDQMWALVTGLLYTRGA